MQSILKKIVWACLIIIPFLALYVADGGALDILASGRGGLYFPFITGKNIIFRILVEVAFAGWVALALLDSKYRVSLKKSPLTIAFGIFMVVLLIADIFGVDREKSIWSNFERMEGFIGHIHFFAYFVVLTAMFSTLKDWRNMFKAFLAADILVLVYGYGQLFGAQGYIFAATFPTLGAWFSSHFPIHMSANRLDATIGNSAYFAVFCLMSAGIAGLLWLQASSPRKAWGYPTLIMLNVIALFYSGTRGTMIGLAGGVVVMLALIAWHEKGRARNIFAGTLVAMVLLVGSLFVFKNTSFVQSSPTLARIASISPTDVTTSSRISIWKISYEAFLERPILGYGQDNFSYIYARKFIPEKMWNLEPWYDRSHNVFFDWLVAGGILGLLSYLSLYAVALWLMWRKKNEMSLREKALITGILAGYFVHNVFVFDNLTSYILFFALLGYIAVRTRSEHETLHTRAFMNVENVKLLWLPLTGVLLVIALYYVNYRPWLVNTLLIRGLSSSSLAQTMPFADVVKIEQDAFVKAIALDTLGSEEAREQFLQTGVRITQVNIPETIPPADKQVMVQAINGFVQAVRDEVSSALPKHLTDVRMLSIAGSFYNGIGDAASGGEILTLAHTLAPKKQLISFDLIRSYLMEKKFAEAYALGRETYDLAPAYPDAKKWYMLSAAYAHALKEARTYILSKGHDAPLDSDVLNALVTTGQIPLAIEMLQELKKTNPEYAPQVDAYIQQILAPGKK